MAFDWKVAFVIAIFGTLYVWQIWQLYLYYGRIKNMNNNIEKILMIMNGKNKKTN